jgi:hypothetical protein
MMKYTPLFITIETELKFAFGADQMSTASSFNE